jgi:LmbE family N-acetylglucosaminyl deacetylase
MCFPRALVGEFPNANVRFLGATITQVNAPETSPGRPRAPAFCACNDGGVPYTLVTFHAHPDDEAIATGGVMAKAKADGHRVVLVVATKGELGEVAEGFLAAGEVLADRRVVETHAAATVLGVDRVEFLGYHDSGMMGDATNDDPGSFWSADVDEAAERLASLLRDENADVLTIYDERGNYGHPDHIKVHHVGHRAAELAGTAQVFEATMNRDYIVRLMTERGGELDLPEDVERPDPEEMDLGMPEAVITTAVDVRDYTDQKRAAMAAHASQIPDNSFFLQLPPEAFREAFGLEWFIRRGARPGIREASLFEHLS